MTPDELDQFFKNSAEAAADTSRTVDSFPRAIANGPTELIHEMKLPVLESPPTGKFPTMPVLEEAPWKTMSKAATPAIEAAETKAPNFLADVASKFPDKESFVKYFKRFASLGEEGASALAKKLGVGGAVESIPAIGGEAALGPLAVGYELLHSAPGPEGLQDYSPSTIAMINAKKNGTPPPSAPEEPSLFDRVHNKYQDLQKEDKIGEPEVQEAKPKGSAKQSVPSAPAPVKSEKDYLNDLMNKLYGGMGDADMKNAQAERNRLQTNALISKAGAQLGTAISRGTGGNKDADTSIQDTLTKQAGQPVEDIETRRKAVTERLEGGLKASDLVDREKLRDANSPVSEAYRNMALTLNPKLASMPTFNQMNAEGIKQLLPMVDLSIKAQVAKDNHDLMFLQKKQGDEAKAKADMSTKIATVLNRGAVAKAMDADRRVDNITSLINMYPDLDKMPLNQVHALTDEITQIVTGGMSTEGKSAKLMSPTLASGFSNLMGKTLGKPTGAQLGSFIQEYVPYMYDLQDNSRNYIKDQIHPIMTGFNKRVAPSDMQEVKETYAKYFDAPAPKSPHNNSSSKTSTPGDNKVTVTNGSKTYRIDPKDVSDAKKDGFTVVGK